MQALAWHESPNKTKSFLDYLVLVPERVPHSFVVSQGSILGGSGRSWSAPVYIIGGHFPDGFPQEEDPVPADGLPHSAHGHAVHVNQNIPPRVFNSGRKKKSEPTDKTDISGISGFFIFIFIYLFIYLFFNLLFSIKNIH